MKTLILFQIRSEFRRKSIILSLLLYLLCLVLINYFTIGIQNVSGIPGIWSALFWMALLSAVVNSIAKSFMTEKSGAGIYFYSVASASQIILSKILYGSFLCFGISITGFTFFAVLLTNPIQNHALFILTLALSSFGFSSSLTILSAIASKTNNGSVVMAVLSFPVTLGVLLMSIKVTKNAIDGLAWSASTDELLILLAINLLATAFSQILFPYIWRS